MTNIKRTIRVIFTDKCSECRRVIHPNEIAFVNEMLKITCGHCNNNGV